MQKTTCDGRVVFLLFVNEMRTCARGCFFHRAFIVLFYTCPCKQHTHYQLTGRKGVTLFMNRTWKFLRAFLWIAAIVAVIGVSVQAFRPFMNEHRTASAGYAQQAKPHGDKQAGYDARGNDTVTIVIGERGQQTNFAGGRFDQPKAAHAKGAYPAAYEHRGSFHGKLFGLFGSLLLLIAGVLLWKRAGRKGRVIGGILIALAALPLLMMALSLLIPIALIYIIWRLIRRKSSCRYKREFEEATDFTATHTYTATQPDFLDEWEAKTRRQLNNKEEE